MISEIYNDGELIEIQKNGRTIWDKNNDLNRSRIGGETKEKLREAETIEDIKEYVARVHDIDLEKQENEEE